MVARTRRSTGALLPPPPPGPSELTPEEELEFREQHEDRFQQVIVKQAKASARGSLQDTVDRVLMAVEARQAAAAASPDDDAFDDDDDPEEEGKGGKRYEVTAGCDGGPLTVHEVAHLGLLCASISTSVANAITDAAEGRDAHNDGNDDGPRPDKNGASSSDSEDSLGLKKVVKKAGWAVVDGVSLSNLTPMLEAHVSSAGHVDLIGEANAVFERRSRGGISLEQWLHPNPRFDPTSHTPGDAPEPGAGHHRISVLRRGLEAASVLLSIMTSPGVDKRAVSDDGIESCVALLRRHLNNVIPALANTGHLAVVRKTTSSAGDKGSSVAPPSKRRKSKGSGSGAAQRNLEQALIRAMKKVYKPILESVGLLSILMERVEALVQAVQLDDQPLLSISSAALSTMAIDPAPSPQNINGANAHLIQVASIGLVSSIFRRYPRHRTIILEDLFPLMLQLPTSKRSLRTYKVKSALSVVALGGSCCQGGQNSKSLVSPNNPSDAAASSASPSPTGAGAAVTNPDDPQTHIQIMTALILSLVQGSVVMPLPVESKVKFNDPNASLDEHGEQRMLPKLTSGLKECQNATDFFTTHLLQRCSRKGEEGGASEFRPVLANLVDDLLLVQFLPEYPAAEMVLLSFCRKLSDVLIKNSSVGRTRRSQGSDAPGAETTYLSTAMDTIGRVCASIASQLKTHRENPLRLPAATDIEAPDRTEENRCICGRDFVDTFMLDCDRCHAWFHGSCVGAAKDNLPEHWVCDECTLQVMVIEQTKSFAERCGRKKKGNNINNGAKKRKHRGVCQVDSDDDPTGIEEPDFDEAHIFRQLLLNYLTDLTHKTKSPALRIAREFHIAKWVKELEQMRQNQGNENGSLDVELMTGHFLDQWAVTCAAGIVGVQGDPAAAPVLNDSNIQSDQRTLSEEGNLKVVRTLAATKSDLGLAFPRLLGVLVSLMGDRDMVSLRKLAVKAIAQVVNVDPMLMVQPTVRQAVAKRFQDEAISVRQAAVSLVGSYVLKAPLVANAFHTSLVARLHDDGVSVRKSTIKLFRDLLLSNPSYNGRANVCTEMLVRAADPKEDDGVRDLIHETFQLLWFESGVCDGNIGTSSIVQVSKPAPESEGGSLANLPIPSSSEAKGNNAPSSARGSRRKKKGAALAAEQRQIRSKETAKQMVEVVASSGSAEFLTSLVKELLFGLGEGDKKSKAAERRKRQKSAQAHCSGLVDALADQLLAFEESRTQASNPDAGRQLVAIISTLGVFADSSPVLLVRHLDTLLPYLKADNGVTHANEAAIVTCVSKVLSHVIPILDQKDVLQLCEGALTDDLVNITYKFGREALSAAVEALSRIAHHRDAGEDSLQRKKLLKLAITFYGYLCKTKNASDDFSKAKKTVRNNVHRALSVLGSICRFHELDKDDMESQDNDPTNFPVLDAAELSWCNMSNACYALISVFLNKEDAPTKCAALQAMGGIFTARPRVLLAVQQTGILSEIISDQSHPDLQQEALKCWRDILLTEERRVESGEAKEQMDSKEITLSNRISGDQDSDASLIGSVLSSHSSRLFAMTCSLNVKIRFSATELIGHLLRQGLINPMESTPYLLALLGDVGAPTVRSLALKLLVREGEKRPDMLRQRVCAGVKQAYYFQRTVYPKKPKVTAIIESNGDGGGAGGRGTECIFSTIFKESVRSSRVQRQGLIKSLLSLFTIDTGQTKKGKNKDEAIIDRLPLMSYASEVLAFLPYNTPNDPLLIIYYITSATSLNSQVLLDRFAAFLYKQNLASDEYADVSCEDEVERAAITKNGGAVAKEMSKRDFDASGFLDLCAEAASLVLLFRLKAYLMSLYRLSHQRCAEYLPSVKDRASDRFGLLHLPERIPSFDSDLTVANALNDKSGTIDICRLISQYAEFRALMRRLEQESHDHHDEEDDDNEDGRRSSGRKRKVQEIAESDDSSSDSEMEE